jgi:transposase
VELLGNRQTEAVIADKGYDTENILAHVKGMNAEAVIPSRRCRKKQRSHNEQLYKQRNRIERCSSRLKQFRRLATRYEKSKICFQALAALACSWLLLQLYVDAA